MQINQAANINNFSTDLEFIEVKEFMDNLGPTLSCLGVSMLLHDDNDNSN